jgi:type II secretory pathway pseudopilin PulG
VIVCKQKILNNNSSGASIIEVVLAMAIVSMATPFVYNQIAKTNQTIKDITIAKQIMTTRDNALNFVRLNQGDWPDIAQIQLNQEELKTISENATAGFIDKYTVSGATLTDVYLSFDLNQSELRAKQIAKHIGTDAAVVDTDGIAYGDTWAVAAPEFKPGNLIYRITRDISGQDTARYLHRATSGEDDFNVMQRDLNMDGHHIYNTASLVAKSIESRNATAQFINTDNLYAETVYFSSGANLSGDEAWFDNLRVSGDMYGFRNIYASDLNGSGYTTNGHIITDKANVLNSINVANNLTIKSDSTRTISGFTFISANSVYTPFVSCTEMYMSENFGLTVSGELLMSTTPPLKIGNWIFPSAKPPQFTNFSVDRANIPQMPNNADFQKITNSDWRTDNNYKETTQQ